jgi:hypothetical protein
VASPPPFISAMDTECASCPDFIVVPIQIVMLKFRLSESPDTLGFQLAAQLEHLRY